MVYDFQTLQTIQAFDAITLRVPARWQCGPKPGDNNVWVCGEGEDVPKELDTGTLWIRLDGFFDQSATSAPSVPSPAQITEGFIENFPRDERGIENETTEETEDGLFWTFESTTEEDGDLLRFYWHRRFIYSDLGVTMIMSNLVIEEKGREDPEYRDLVKMIDREMREAAVVPPPHWLEDYYADDHVKALSSLKLNNFAGLCKIGMPDILDEITNDGDGNWICRTTVERYPFEVTVATERPAPKVHPAEAFGESVRQSWPAESRVTYAEGGQFCHHWRDDGPTGEPGWRGDDCRRHDWQYLHEHHNDFFIINICLRFPQDRVDQSPFPYLVSLLNREIREMKFPRLPKPSDWFQPELNTAKTEILGGSTVHLPDDWSGGPEDDQTWWGRSEDGRASLKVQHDIAPPPKEPFSEISPEAIRARYVTETKNFLRNLKPVESIQVSDVLGGSLVHTVTKFRDQGELEFNYRWHLITGLTDGAVITRYILSMDEELADTPRARALVSHFAEEMGNIMVTSSSKTADPLTPLRDVKIGDFATIRLPVTMKVKEDHERENQWYASFHEDGVPASMWINLDHQTIQYEDGDTFDPADLPDDLLKGVMEPWLDGGNTVKAAQGWVQHEIEDEERSPEEPREDEIDPDDWRNEPSRNHIWKFIHPQRGGVLNLTFLLMIPGSRADEAPLPDLIALLHREIRALRFTLPPE